MAEQSDELTKLVTVASDMGFSAELRTKAIKQIGNIYTREALLALLELAANEGLVRKERELALKYAREIIRSSRG
jgi:hypothetical protein